MAAKQKHIKIADQSDFGWGTVAHYQEDLLASGPEDEKEIDRAKSRAENDAIKMQKEEPTSSPEVEAGITIREDASSTRILPGTIFQGQVVATMVTGETNGGLPPLAVMPQRPYKPKV